MSDVWTPGMSLPWVWPGQERQWEPQAGAWAGPAACRNSRSCGWLSALTGISLSVEVRGQPWNLWGEGTRGLYLMGWVLGFSQIWGLPYTLAA